MAIGMLISSPLAGIWADRHGSRALAAVGMLVSAGALAGMTTLQVHSPYWQSILWLGLVGIGSGMFNSPNTAAMMGTVPAGRRGIAGGARTMLQNTGAVISIAFVLAIITAAVPKDVLFQIFSGVASGLSDARLEPFIANMHTALWVLAATSVVGAARLPAAPGARPRGGRGRVTGKPLRIGEVAEQASTTVRTVRYYEEVGLLPGSEERSHGEHRTYSDADVERLREILQLKELLNLSLDELRGLVEAEEARAVIRERYRSSTDAAERERLLQEAAHHLDRQLALVRERRTALGELEERLAERRERVTERLAELRPSPARRG